MPDLQCNCLYHKAYSTVGDGISERCFDIELFKWVQAWYQICVEQREQKKFYWVYDCGLCFCILVLYVLFSSFAVDAEMILI